MKQKRIYYRRKGKSIIIEGKSNGKSVLIWTLPNPEKLLLSLIGKASLITGDKMIKIPEKMERLDRYYKAAKKKAKEVRTTKINSIPKLDALSEEEQNESVAEMMGDPDYN